MGMNESPVSSKPSQGDNRDGLVPREDEEIEFVKRE